MSQTMGYEKLIDKIAEKFKINCNQITIGAGASEVIDRISRTYLSNSRDCIIYEPTFFRLKDSALKCTSNISAIRLNKECNYQITKKEIKLLNNFRDNSLVWICSPNNPAGSITPLETVKEIAEENPEKLICVDEAYGDYLVDWDENYSAVNLIDNCKNVLVIRTFSKLLGLAGLIIGYAIGDEDIINPLNDTRLDFPITDVSEKISLKVLDNWDKFKEMAVDIADRREEVQSKLDELKNIEYMPSKTSIILMRHKNRFLHKELLADNILTANMNTCDGINDERWIRATIQLDNNENTHLLNALKKVDGI